MVYGSGKIRSQRHRLGEDRGSVAGQEIGSWRDGEGQPAVSRSRAVACPGRVALAGPASRVRPLEQRVHALPPLGAGDGFERIFKALSGEPDFEYAMIDGTIVTVHQNPLINQSAPLRPPQNRCRIESGEQGIGSMRAIMQGLTDAEFEQLYGTEEQCLAAWVKVRREAGMACPRCGNPKSYVYDRRVGCTRCDMRWSITSGTVMADTKLPLTTWFRAMHLMSSTKQCISAVELGRRLGVSYPSAWYLHKRLRHAMTEESDRCQLGAPAEAGWTPIVEADDVYLGGERNEGRGTAGKTRVIAAAERHPSGRMGSVAMAVVSGFSNEEAAAFRDAHLVPGAHVHTDGTSAFHVFGDGRRPHVSTLTGGKRPGPEARAPFFHVHNP